MATEIITLEVDSEAASLFRRASPEEQEKMQALVSNLLKELSGSNGPSLKEVVGEIGCKAREKGMTPEILDSLLDR